MKKYLLGIGILAISGISFAGDFSTHYVGGDISLLPLYENAGSIYKDADGEVVSLLPFLEQVGLNAMRVRLFVDPVSFISNHPGADPNACQDLEYIIPLCQDIVNQGFDLMLDFHYSDTWADPEKQWIPARWEGLNEQQLVEAIYSYTKNSLEALKDNGVVPKFIQTGNEISYGMLWAPYGGDPNANKVWQGTSEASWQRLANLLISAGNACREICPDAKIIIHNERVEYPDYLVYYYNKLAALGVDYDIIGLSYYPYWHGKINVLDNALSSLEINFPEQELMVVETGFSYRWGEGDQSIPLDYPISEAGQNQYAQALVNTLNSHPNATGLFWWWLEYNAYPYPTTQLEGWYNASLFDNESGKAQQALYTIATFATEYNGVESIMGNDSSSQDNRWFDINGFQISQPTKPGIYIHNKEKVIIK